MWTRERTGRLPSYGGAKKYKVANISYPWLPKDELPVELEGARQVVDLAYNADGSPTALVEGARQAGCERVVDGVDVLLAQGAASFERWTEVPAPLKVMRAAVRSLPS